MSPTIDARPGAPRKFTAATSREALRLARESLGEDALVLASRAAADGFEIVAMAEQPVHELVDAAGPAAGAAVVQELHAMRGLIEERFGALAWNEGQRRDPVRGSLLRTMLQAGFSPRLSQALIEQLPGGRSYADGLAFVRAELARALQVQEDEEDVFAAGGVYALVGPTGVGKTTTTAKLAARFVMRFGPDKLALVTTDAYRIGAYEQLRIYGEILGVRVHAVKDPAGLDAVLRELRDKHMVLIDTVGMSQRDRAVADQIAMLDGAARPVQRLLLLNAATHGDTLNEVVYAWQQAGQGNRLAGCIFTKVDEATSRGALLDTVIRHRLPVYYLSDGQKVPENLALPERHRLVNEALMAPARGALFVCDPGLATGAAADGLATAQAESDRLRQRYDRLIQAMAHDAEAVAAAASDLERADVGFRQAQRLWTAAAERTVDVEAVLGELVRLARGAVTQACSSHVLALSGRAGIDVDGGERIDLHGCLLLSDRTGHPVAAPRQWIAPQGSPRAGARQFRWLAEQDFGRPVVHLLPSLGPGDDFAALQDAQWVARAAATLSLADAKTGRSTMLSKLGFRFGEPATTTLRDRPAQVAYGEADACLRAADGSLLQVRAVARRTCDATGGRVLEQSYVIARIAAPVAAQDLVRWQEWGLRAAPCLRLAGKGLELLGGMTELGAPAAMKRLLVAAQVATTAWRLLDAETGVPARTLALLAELAGRRQRADRTSSGPALYQGLARLFQLLQALRPEDFVEEAR